MVQGRCNVYLWNWRTSVILCVCVCVCVCDEDLIYLGVHYTVMTIVFMCIHLNWDTCSYDVFLVSSHWIVLREMVTHTCFNTTIECYLISGKDYNCEVFMLLWTGRLSLHDEAVSGCCFVCMFLFLFLFCEIFSFDYIELRKNAFIC